VLLGDAPARARVLAEQTREHLLAAAADDAGIADARFDGSWTPRPHVHA
jgi:hypothetical protein